MNKRWFHCLCAMGILFFTLLGACSCGAYTEPEEIWAVSAVGVDPHEDGIRLTLELPVLQTGDSGEAKALVLHEIGKSTAEAYDKIQAVLAKKTVFSHCAAIVLGEGLSREQMEEFFDFSESGEGLPLAAEVVISANALELLQAKALSEPTVGYELTEIIKRERLQTGVNVGCSLFELRGDPSAREVVILPRFAMLGEEASGYLASDGYTLLRTDRPPLRLSREEGLPYAVLSGNFVGTQTGTNAPSDWIRGGTAELAVDPETEPRCLRVILHIRTEGRSAAVEEWASSLRDDAERLLIRLQKASAGDVMGAWRCVGGAVDAEIRQAFSELAVQVTCELDGGR